MKYPSCLSWKSQYHLRTSWVLFQRFTLVFSTTAFTSRLSIDLLTCPSSAFVGLISRQVGLLSKFGVWSSWIFLSLLAFLPGRWCSYISRIVWLLYLLIVVCSYRFSYRSWWRSSSLVSFIFYSYFVIVCCFICFHRKFVAVFYCFQVFVQFSGIRLAFLRIW